MDIKESKTNLLPPLKVPYINLKKSVCDTPSTDTGRYTIRYIATARTKKLYKLLGINEEGNIYNNLDAKLDLLLNDLEYKKLTQIEKTDFCQHLLSFLQTNISDIRKKRIRRDVQIPKLKLTSKKSNLYSIALTHHNLRKKWKRWKQIWFEKYIILTKFLLLSNCDIKILAPKLEEMNIKLEHLLIYCIQHKTSLSLLQNIKHINITLKSIRSYRYELTPGWLKRATPYIDPSIISALKSKRIQDYLKVRKRHRKFVKNIRRKIKRKKRRSPFSGVVASAGNNIL